MKNSRCCFDSNIWLYLFLTDTNSDSSEEVRKHHIAKNITNADNNIISIQVINEVCAVLLRKAKVSEIRIKQIIQEFYDGCIVIEINHFIIIKASELRTNYNFSFWDSLIIASALFSGANILYSEDMQDGLIVDNQLTILNPFKI